MMQSTDTKAELARLHQQLAIDSWASQVNGTYGYPSVARKLAALSQQAQRLAKEMKSGQNHGEGARHV